MIDHVAIHKQGGQFFMFYNINNYGFDGIGMAVAE